MIVVTNWEYAVIPLITGLREAGAMAKSLPTPFGRIIKSIDTQKELLNKLGAEGWELVSTTLFEYQGNVDVMAYFKREKK